MKFGNSLTAKLVKIFLGVYVVVAVGVTGYHLFAVFRNETKFVFAELEKLREYSEPVLSEALWQFNDAGLESSLKGLTSQSLVIGAAVTDDKGNPVAALGIVEGPEDTIIEVKEDGEKVPIGNDALSLDKLYRIDFPITHHDPQENEPKTIGYGTLYSSFDVVLERAKPTIYLLIVNKLIETLAIGAILIIAFWFIVVRPVRNLTHEVAALNPVGENTGETQESDRMGSLLKSGDEIGALAREFSEMAADIREKSSNCNRTIENLRTR